MENRNEIKMVDDKRIKRIQIQWLQSIKHLDIKLDRDVTRIAGKNASGKSAIAKGLSLFTGTYKRGEINGLVARDRPRGETTKVLVSLFNGNHLMAEIHNTTKVRYSLYKGKDLEKVWEMHSPEITDLLGWRTIGEDSKTSLDIKDSKKNLLVDTTARENAEMVDDLYRNVDIELRIANLEENLKEIQDSKKIMREKRSTYYVKKEETGTIDKLTLMRIKDSINNIDRRELTNSARKINYKNLLLQKESKNSLKMAELICKLIYIRQIKEYIDLKTNIGRVSSKRQIINHMSQQKGKILTYNLFMTHQKYIDKLNKTANITKRLLKLTKSQKKIVIASNKDLVFNLLNQRREVLYIKKEILTKLGKLNLNLEKKTVIFNENNLKNVNKQLKQASIYDKRIQKSINTVYLNKIINKKDKCSKMKTDCKNITMLLRNKDVINQEKHMISLNKMRIRLEDNSSRISELEDNVVRFTAKLEENGLMGAYIEASKYLRYTSARLEDMRQTQCKIIENNQKIENILDKVRLNNLFKKLINIDRNLKTVEIYQELCGDFLDDMKEINNVRLLVTRVNNLKEIIKAREEALIVVKQLDTCPVCYNKIDVNKIC